MTRHTPLYAGLTAILIWSWSATLISTLTVPPFEAMSIILALGLVTISIHLTYQKRWSLCQQPWPLWVFGGLGLVGNHVGYFLAFQYSPAVTVDLIICLWPFYWLLLYNLKRKSIGNKWQWLASLMGCTALLLILPHTPFTDPNWAGIAWALFAALSWCGYMLVAIKYPHTPPEIASLCLTLGLPLLYGLHHYYEPNLMPNFAAWTKMILLGIGAIGLGFCLWDYGIKKGPVLLLTQCAYATPLLSILWLVCFGQAQLTPNLAWAGGLLVIANWLSYKNNNH